MSSPLTFNRHIIITRTSSAVTEKQSLLLHCLEQPCSMLTNDHGYSRRGTFWQFTCWQYVQSACHGQQFSTGAGDAIAHSVLHDATTKKPSCSE